METKTFVEEVAGAKKRGENKAEYTANYWSLARA